MRQHLEVAAVTSPEARADLQGPPAPQGMDEVWRMFSRLNATRTSSGFGANPITYLEIESMSRLTGTPVAPWQVDLLRVMDSAFLSAVADKT